MTAVNPMRAFAYDTVGSVELPILSATGPNDLPAGIVVPPGVYNVAGVRLDMSEERLYRIDNLDNTFLQVATSAGDIDKLITSIGWMTYVGYGDGVTYRPRDEAGSIGFQNLARQKVISTSCGATAYLAATILGRFGVNSRITGGLSLNNPLNSYDNGHTIMDIDRDGKRIAHDFLLKYRFILDPTGEYLSTLGLHDCIYNDIPYSLETFVPGGARFDSIGNRYLSLHEFMRSNPKEFYKRDFQMPYMFYGYTQEVMYENAFQQNLIASGDIGSGMVGLSRSAFEATFFGKTYSNHPPAREGGYGAMYTIFDPGMQLPPGETVVGIGALLKNAQTVNYKILQKTGAMTWKDVLTIGHSHPGGNTYSDHAVNFSVPGPGYFVAMSLNPPGNEALSWVGNRNYVAGDLGLNQSATFGQATDGSVCMRYTIA